MNQLTGRTRRILAATIGGAAVALSIGGIAYATGDDPAPDSGYAVVEDSPGTAPGQDGTAREDCPEKSGGQNEGQGQGQGSEETPQSTDPQGQA
jgi:hypothetical protein